MVHVVGCGRTPVGHAGPTEIRLQPGHLLHFDFGVKFEGYCSDIQRIAYVLREGETEAPLEVQRGFLTIRTAIEKSREAMKAGATGNSIDVISREVVTDSGYPEFMHALGHQLPAMFTGARSQVNNPIGSAHRVFVMLNHQHGIAKITQAL